MIIEAQAGALVYPMLCERGWVAVWGIWTEFGSALWAVGVSTLVLVTGDCLSDYYFLALFASFLACLFAKT